MKKYYVMFKWKDFFGNESFETKTFDNKHKALNFKNKIEKETKSLIRKYGRHGIYHPFYEINLIESELKDYGTRRKNR